MITSEVIKEKHTIVEYEKCWEDLMNSGKYEISASLEWTQALLKTHLLSDDEFLVIMLKDSERIVGIIPIVIRKGRNYGISVVHAFPIAELYNTHSDLLIDGLNAELAKAFISALFNIGHKWDVFRLRGFVETNPVLEGIECYLKDSPLHYEIRREEPSFFIPLGNSYDDYLKQRSASFRNKLKICTKRLQSIGDVTYSKIRDSQHIDEAYNYILYIEEKSWKHKNGTSITAKNIQREFYKHLCENASKKGWLRLAFLFLNSEPIAYEMGLVKDKKYYGLKGSYHEKFKKESPPTVLIARFIEDLIDDGITEYDFTGEPYEWERKWTDKLRWHRSLVIYNHSIKAKMYSNFNFIKNVKKRDFNDTKFEYRNAKDIMP
jgi:CelD/BcsL family acetyltransferase involved in cellulose biosynthesis